MKRPFTVRLFACALAFALCASAAHAQTQTTDTRIGTLKLFDGAAGEEATVVLLTRFLRLSEVHFDRT